MDFFQMKYDNIPNDIKEKIEVLEVTATMLNREVNKRLTTNGNIKYNFCERNNSNVIDFDLICSFNDKNEFEKISFYYYKGNLGIQKTIESYTTEGAIKLAYEYL